MARKKQADEGRSWTGVFAQGGPSAWIKRELEEEAMPAEELGPPGARPVSVRVERETLALLDAFAQRFRTSRSGILLELIRSGLAEGFRALPDEDKKKIADAVRAKCPSAGGFHLPAEWSPLPDDEK